MPAMGANVPKSELDRRYRALVSAWLQEIMERRGWNKTHLGEALGRDRATASRYLSGKVRAPLQQLTYLDRQFRERVPREVEDAFWASEGIPEALGTKAG